MGEAVERPEERVIIQLNAGISAAIFIIIE
jgi:hypothetical protein